MSRRSLMYNPSSLRSLEQERHQMRLAAPVLSGYLLRKEAWDRGTSSRQSLGNPPMVCQDPVVQNALYTGNIQAVKEIFSKGFPSDLVIQPQGGAMRWRANGKVRGLWSLTYEQELTTPLHITAGRGFTECLRHLLLRGARVDLAPGGTTALHEACEECQPDCVKLLLQYGANPNSTNEDGQMPLHVCTEHDSLECAKQLLAFGASISSQSLDDNDTPLHVAARHGLPDHVELYLRHGAALNLQNDEGNTPLNAACSQPQDCASLERYSRVCHMLVAAGADIYISDADRQTPLHMACKNANPDVVVLLLKNKALVNEMDYGGDAPLHNILKVVAYKTDHEPERIVQALLNYGSIRVWPGALPKVLKYCCTSPRTIEVLFNAYDRLKITESWVEAVAPEVFQKHREFYESLFALMQTPRSLQHLARHRLRTFLEGRLDRVVPKLGLPTFLKNYLMLAFRDYMH
ncbi:ankyrin repeat and SOCS box 10-like isoform X1 [Labeo rohita]|uniref:Ankyrin repeat and SOCS box 10-like isoform X1 n=1 Tax=Labeo rohita TaxID=84645 RepID=A0A498MVD1_LABRO|nr:ankyrin repeat and SOCS box protein 10 isoform X1 [Labeo rohita]RXN24680.1 ankyrin repeat and SOCS box 10-like isoform X1 [Labeo rohita]